MYETGLIVDDDFLGSSSDYILEDNTEALAELEKQTVSGRRTYYNQYTNPDTRQYCTIYSCFGALGDLLGTSYTNEQIKAVGDAQVEKGLLSRKNGGSAPDGVDAVRRWNNENSKQKVKTYRLPILSKVFWKALEKGHRIVLGYNLTKEYQDDAQDNGVVNGTSYPGRIGGHLTTCFLNDGKVKVGDSYEGRVKYNVYTVESFKELAETRMYYGNTYLFLKDNTMETQAEKDNVILEEAKTLGLWNGEEQNRPATRREVVLMIMRAKENLK